MNYSKSLFLAALMLLKILCAFSQEKFSFNTMNPVETNIKKRSNSNSSYEYNHVFKLPENQYLYVRSFHTSMLLPGYHKANVFLFDASGKLLSSNLDMMDKGEMGEDRIFNVVQFSEKALIVTIKDEGKKYVCKFWDVSEAKQPNKVKELDVIKFSSSEPYPKMKTSKDGNFLLVVSGNAHNLVVLDRDFETVYSKNLIPSKKEGGNKDNHIDAFEIDDEGYVGLSVLLREPPGWLTASTEGSWLFIGIDILEDKVTSWNLAEVWKLSRFVKGNSEITAMDNGKVAFTYSSTDLSVAIIDLKEGQLNGAVTVESDFIHGGPPKKNEYRSMRNDGVYGFGDGHVAAMIHTWAANSGDYLIILDDKCNIESHFEIDKVGDLDYDAEKAFTQGNRIWIPSLIMPENIANIGKKNASNVKYNDKLAAPVFVSYESKGGQSAYIKGAGNPKVSGKNKIYLFDTNGLMSYLEFKGGTVTLNIYELNN